MDVDSDTAYADITVNPPPLVIDATTVTIEAGDSHTFLPSGGTTPYTFAVIAGVGTINAGGLYTSAIPGSATVRVQDTSPTMQTVFASVTVNPTPLCDQSDQHLHHGRILDHIRGVRQKIARLHVLQAYGVGSVNATTGEYTSPTTGSAVIRVTDSTTPTPLTANADVTVTAPPLQITPTAVNLQVNPGQDFNATGGIGTHVYSVVSGNGSIVPSTGVFTAPATPDTTVVQVRDDALSTSLATITVYARLAIWPKAGDRGCRNDADLHRRGRHPRLHVCHGVGRRQHTSHQWPVLRTGITGKRGRKGRGKTRSATSTRRR